MDFTILLLLCSSLVAAEPLPEDFGRVAPDTLVICDPQLEPALAPWLRHRGAQGHQISVITEFESADDIKRSIRRASAAGRLRYVVLVGDVRPDNQGPERMAHVPTHMAAARINVRWGSEPEIATDNWFADLNDDGVPELAIGRLTAGTGAELSRIVQKILLYERTAATGLWRRRVNLVAGVGGFGPMTDAVLESATRSFLSRGIPAEFRTSMTYASWRSPYCPDPRLFRQTVINRLNEGCFCWVYIGHGYRKGLDWIRVPVGAAPILQSKDVSQVQSVSGMPIAVFLSCYSGAFDHNEDCLAETMLQREGGPVAVLAGSRVTMPYGMAVLSSALMNQLFRQQQETLGDILLTAKRQTMDAEDAGLDRRLLNLLASAMSPNADDLAGERREHLHMFNLLGDPLLRVRHPQAVEVKTSVSVESGKELPIDVRTDVAGNCLVELVCRRGRFTYDPVPRTQFDGSSAGMKALTTEYHRANDDRFVARRFQAPNRGFRVSIPVPEHATGPCQVRVFVDGEREFAMGSARVFVQKPKETKVSVSSDSAGTGD